MNEHSHETIQAYVAFTGKSGLFFLRFLRKGFRHCFVILNDGKRWLSIDPLANYTDIVVHDIPSDFDLPKWLENRNYRVVPAQLRRPPKSAPWMAFTCVEAVKRILGLHKRLIITPWQLYRHLLSENKKLGIAIPNSSNPPIPFTDHIQNNLKKGDLQWEV